MMKVVYSSTSTEWLSVWGLSLHLNNYLYEYINILNFDNLDNALLAGIVNDMASRGVTAGAIFEILCFIL